MLYYILFWTLSSFIIHFYIIFGTNLLTQGLVKIESKWNETFGNVIFGTNKIQETWTLCQATNMEAMR